MSETIRAPEDLAGALSIQKNSAISLAKTMLPQIRFNSIYAYADNLFDKQEVPFGDPSIQTEIDFLKNTKLEDLEFENTESPKFFTMRNKRTGESIEVSNRESSKGELRGRILRQYLQSKTEEHGEQTAYDIISHAVKSPVYSDMIAMMRGALCMEEVRMMGSEPMHQEHFNLFITVLLDKIDEKIRNGEIPAVEPKQIRDAPELQEQIWKGIDIAQIYEYTAPKYNELSQFNAAMEQLQEKATSLKLQGHTKASEEVSDIYAQLSAKRNSYVCGEIDTEQFASSCTSIVDDAQNKSESQIQKHHGVIENIFHSIRKALNVITVGLVEVKPSELMQKTRDMKSALADLRPPNVQQELSAEKDQNATLISSHP